MKMPFKNEEEVELRREKLYEHYDAYLDNLIDEAAQERERQWNRDFSSPEAYEKSVEQNRKHWTEDFLTWGGLERGDLKPRVETLVDDGEIRMERVWLTVFGDVETDLLLLTPKGDAPLPTVIAQHGLGSTPELVVGFPDDENAYHGYGLALARRGYVVCAPRMVTFWEKRQRLHRKAILLGKNLMGLEIFAESRVIDFLQTLPQVRADRIGVYGLSQGGQTALWLGAADTRLAATVSSAFFNSRTEKMVVSGGDHYTAYIDSPEEDKHYWGQLLEFSDSDIASLICPRPFMPEAGLQDKAAPGDMQAREFAIVKGYYEHLGIGERAEIDVFDGGHEIHGTKSFEFLDRWLKT